MALLHATQLNDLQATNATNEKRYSELGLVNAVSESTKSVDFILPSGKDALSTMDSLRNYQLPYLKDQTVTVNFTPGFSNIPSNLPESAQQTYVAVDVFSGFRYFPAQFANNSMDAEATRVMVMNNVLHKMGQSVEGLLATTLELQKTQTLDFTTQVSQGNGVYTFNTGTDLLEISKAAQKGTMFYELESLMDSNDLGGNYRIVTNPGGLTVQKSQALQSGQGNSVNLQALGFFGEDRMHQSRTISAGSDIFNGWLIQDGAIGMIENFPFDFRNGTSIGGRTWSISDMKLPHINMRCNIYVNNEATDATALVNPSTSSDMKMTHFQEMAFWNRFYIVFPPNSDLTNRPNPIVKIKGLTT
jgi:hypothetical protein